jgi:hypothetical protein
MPTAAAPNGSSLTNSSNALLDCSGRWRFMVVSDPVIRVVKESRYVQIYSGCSFPRLFDVDGPHTSGGPDLRPLAHRSAH